MLFFFFQVGSTPAPTPFPLSSPTDWISVFISLGALVVSGITLYLLWLSNRKKYSPMVYPSPRLAITKQDISGQVKPTLALRCGYENTGAISGKIEALMISIRTSLGGTSKFSGVLVRDLLDIVTETGQPQQRLRDFSTISLGKGERKWEDVLFVPIDVAFDLKQTCKMVLRIHYIVDVKNDDWFQSTVSYTFDFNEAALREWQTRGTVWLEADELIKSRNDFLISE